jgi:hypothetical protein
LKHGFGRFGLALEADAAQIASDQRSDGISMFDLTFDASRLLRQMPSLGEGHGKS